MPTLTRWFIKAAWLHLLLALLLAVGLALPAEARPVPWLGRLGPVYFHLFMVGWVTQMIFGVIYWMFPIISREQPRGRPFWGWLVFVTLNGGLLLRLVFEPLPAETLAAGDGWFLVASATLQWLAAVVFVTISWPRIKEKYRGE